MVYVIVGTKNLTYTMLVRADDKDEITQRIILAEDEKIVGRFTASEIQALDTSRFTVVSSGSQGVG